MTEPNARFPHAMAPIQLGRLTVRNRIFVPAHTTNFGVDHLPSERHLAYHRERARGGVGAIIFESIRVQSNCLGRPQAVGGFTRDCIEPFSRLARAVQAEGAALLGQVIHLGRQVDGDFERTVSWGPSPVRWSATSAMPHAMTPDDMQTVIDGHVQTARNLIEAGLDGLEIQLGHGHLLQQFLSPLSNTRTDAFGGSLENRLRFPLAVVEAVRSALGPHACIGIRVSGDEFVEGGLHLDEVCAALAQLACAVPLDFVNVSHSAYHASYSLATQMADMAFDPQMFRHLPGAVRSALHAAGAPVPVLSVCRYDTLAEAEDMIARGQADMVGMARAHLAEPALVAKTLAGREDEIQPCIACNQGCAGMLEKNMPIRCVVNPRAGVEATWAEPAAVPTAQPLDVLVVGGGPAGLEAAWTAAARGHHVELWEAGDALGGQLQALQAMPSRARYLQLLEHQRRAVQRHGVTVRLGRRADAQAIVARRPDAVVLATGSLPVAPGLAGGGRVFGIEAALRDPVALGDAVAFADLTGEWASLSVVEHLADLGKRVTVYSPVAATFWRTTIYSTLATSRRLRDKGVRLAPLRRLQHWDGHALQVEDVSCGDVQTLTDVDAVVIAQYNLAADSLRAPLRAAGIRVLEAGDCLAPRTAMEAVYEGAGVAYSL